MFRVMTCIALAGLVWIGGCTSRIYSTPPETGPVSPEIRDAKTRPYTVMGRTYYPLKTARGYDEVGLASWYGRDFHGKKTASGQVYNMYGLSAAHKILPLGTRIRVTNLENNQTTVLTVNDRGPFIRGRILDLSYGAAKRLGTVGRGVVRVRITAIGGTPANDVQTATAPLKRFHVRVGAFAVRSNAEQVYARLQSAGYAGANIVTISRDGQALYIVQAGSFLSRDKAEDVLVRLKEEFPSCYIIS